DRLDRFDDRADAHARADALRGQAVLAAAAAKFVSNGEHEPGAGRAERVPNRDRAAVYVHAVQRDSEFLAGRDDLGGERLVELNAINLVGGDARVAERLLG